jgi:SlyX protein
MGTPDTGSGRGTGPVPAHDATNTDARLTELEIKLGFSEDLLEELNHTVFRQQQQIEELQRHIRMLREQIQASMPDEQRSLTDDLPPHY